LNIRELISVVQTLPHCKVLPPSELPSIEDNLLLPPDVKEFYEVCGGMILFENESYSVKIVSPNEVVLANPVIIDEEIIEAEKAKGDYESKISTGWYIIADLDNSDYLVIDFNKNRLGKCYKAFWDSYPSIGDTPIVANSFTELLNQLVLNKGGYWYFLEDDFKSLGDAYDNA
jgi:antitoxin YokJ